MTDEKIIARMQAEGQLCPVAAATALTKSERQQGCNEGQKQTDTTNTK